MINKPLWQRLVPFLAEFALFWHRRRNDVLEGALKDAEERARNGVEEGAWKDAQEGDLEDVWKDADGLWAGQEFMKLLDGAFTQSVDQPEATALIDARDVAALRREFARATE